MNDLISRQAVLSYIDRIVHQGTGKQKSFEFIRKYVEKMPSSQPTIDAVEVVHGEWIEVHDWLQIPQEESGTYRCSACGQVMKYPWNYCPNCGAKMDGEEQNDEQID